MFGIRPDQQNIDQKLEAILAGIGVGHLPRQRIQPHLDSGALISLEIVQENLLENFIAWKINNKGKGLQALTQRLAVAAW